MIRVLLFWLLLCGQAFGTVYFVDSTTGDRDDADDWDQYLEIDTITPAAVIDNS
jgi:hypothetical protein